MSKLARHGISVFAARVIAMGLTMASSMLIARLLGPDGRGKYALMILLPMLLSVPASLGVANSNVHLLKRSSYSVDNFVSNSILFALGASLLTVLVFWGAYRLGVSRYLTTLSYGETFIPLVLLPVNMTFIYLQNVLIGLDAVGRYNKTNILLSLCILLFICLFLLDLRLTVWEAVASWILAHTCTMIYTFRCCVREAGGFRFAPNRALAVESLRYGLKSHAGTIFDSSRHPLEVIIIGYLMDRSAVGYYSVAFSLTQRLQLLPKSIGYILFPAVSKASSAEGRKLAADAIRNTLYVMLLVAVPFVLLSRYVILVLFGPDFLPAQVVLCILSGGLVVSTVILMFGSLALGQGKPQLFSYASGGAFVATLILDFALIPRFGLTGAATANVLGTTFMALFYTVLYLRDSGVRESGGGLRDLFIPKREDWKRLTALLAAAVEAVRRGKKDPGKPSGICPVGQGAGEPGERDRRSG